MTLLDFLAQEAPEPEADLDIDRAAYWSVRDLVELASQTHEALAALAALECEVRRFRQVIQVYMEGL